MTALPSAPAAATVTPLRSHPPGPDPARLAGLLAAAWFEVRSGRRTLEQLSPLITPAVGRRLAMQVQQRSRARRSVGATVRRVVASRPAPDACEAVVLVDCNGRTTAVAIRMERHRGSWRAVDLTAPEDGLPALTSRPTRRQHDAFDDDAFDALGATG